MMAVKDGEAHLATWLDLVPRQMSTGDRTILGDISKRGVRHQNLWDA